MVMAMDAFRSTADARGDRGSRIQPQPFDSGSLMLRLRLPAEAIVPEAGKAAVDQMLENENIRVKRCVVAGLWRNNKTERAWKMEDFFRVFVCLFV